MSVVAPHAEVTAGPTAADTEVTGGPVEPDLLAFVLAVAFGELDTEHQIVDTDPEMPGLGLGLGPGLGLVYLASGVEHNNMPETGSHLEGVPQAEVAPWVCWGEKAVGQLGGAGQELIAARACPACYRLLSDQQLVGKPSPLSAGSGWMKRILSVQAEAWRVLSAYRQVPVCLLGAVPTCEPAVHTYNEYSNCFNRNE